jgi:hypothetical protein
MTVIFAIVGVLVLWAVLDAWFFLRRVEVDPRGVRISGGLFGLGRTRDVTRHEVATVTAVAGSQQGRQAFFSIKLRTRGGKSLTLGRGVPGKYVADLLAAEIEKDVRGR